MVVAGLVGFTHELARAGVSVGTDRTAAFVEAVREIDIADAGQLYWAGRITLCGEPDEIASYDRVFGEWFLGAAPPRVDSAPRRTVTVAPLRATSPSDDAPEAGEPDLQQVGASVHEVLRHRDLAELSPTDRAALHDLFALLRHDPPARRSLRLRPARRGAVDPRRTVRSMLASGGEPVRPRRRARSRRPRRVVLLIDVSGSMEPYADALLRFAHAVVRRTPRSVEVFTLGTRLTRVSRQLRLRNPDQALAAAARAVPDFAGGTRLGETVRAFLDKWGQRGVARSAIVVLFSDGWERGDPALLGEQLARLRRLAHTVIWVNPHAGRVGYEPVQSGIAAALPHLDRLLAGHSLATLEQLLAAMRAADSRLRPPRSVRSASEPSTA